MANNGRRRTKSKVVAVTPPVTSVPEQKKAELPAVTPTSTQASSITRSQWLRGQFTSAAVLKMFLTLGILGFIPGAWMIGLPILTIYGLIKRETVAQGIRRFFSFRSATANNLTASTAGEKIADFLITYYAGILRWFATLILFFTMPIGFGLFASYGLLRFTTSEWLEIFQQRCQDIYNFVLSAANRVLRDASTNIKLILGISTTLLLGLSVLTSGIGVLFAYSIALCQLAAVLVGATAAARDLWYAIRNPGITATQHSGKIAGTTWGHWLAFRLFPGQISGSMGPAMGQVQSYGLFSGLTSSFLNPNGWFIFNSGGILGVLFSRFMSFFNSIFTNVFISQSMQIQGDFYGVIGPSTLQLIAMMAVGCLVGYAVEKFVDSLYNEMTEDSKKVADASKRGARAVNRSLANALYRTRWALGFILCSTPLIVGKSAAGATLIALAGGSIVGASALTVAGLATAIGLLYGAGYGLKALGSKILAHREQRQAVTTPAVTTAQVAKTLPKATKDDVKEAIKAVKPTAAKAKVFTPSFNKSKAPQKSVVAEKALRRSPRLAGKV
ncbi:MAG: hypothetical protein AB7I18_08305 [Candidatus Berkiella sp.]